MKKWKVTDSKYLYQSPHGNFRIDTCLLPNGNVTEYNVNEFSDWVDIVAINDKKELVLVKQYRHPAEDFFTCKGVYGKITASGVRFV